jgi:hypothetical protein
MKKFLIVASAMALSVATANAATLSGVTGPVSVNVGEGFATVVGSADLKVGDKVLVGEGGMAALTQGDCTVSIDKPTLLTITETPICESSQVAVMPTADIDPPVAAGLPILPLILLGTAGAVGTYFVVKEVLDEENDPVS